MRARLRPRRVEFTNDGVSVLVNGVAWMRKAGLPEELELPDALLGGVGVPRELGLSPREAGSERFH